MREKVQRGFISRLWVLFKAFWSVERREVSSADESVPPVRVASPCSLL